MSRPRRPSYMTEVMGQFLHLKGLAQSPWIVGVLYLNSCPTEVQMKVLVKEKLFQMSRFKSVLKCSPQGAEFIEMSEDEFDWKYHFSTKLENELVSEERLKELIGQIFANELDVEKPLWKLALVPKLQGGNAALVTFVNHAIGDGVSMIGALLKVSDDSPIDPTKPLQDQRKSCCPELSSSEVGGKLIAEKRSRKPDVSLFTRVAMFFYGIKEGLLGTFGSIDPHSSLKMKKANDFDKTYTGEKLLAKTPPINLDEIKELKGQLGNATINDILLALLTMTVRSYLEENNDPILEQHNQLTGNFPVSMRGPKDAMLKDENPSNNFAPLAFRFPFDYTSAVDCVWKVKDQIDKHKVSPQLTIQHFSAQVMTNILPRDVMIEIALRLQEKTTAQLSNIAGPQRELHICGGIAITDMCFYLFSPLGIYLGIISYAGKVTLSVNMDATLKQRPETFITHWENSFHKLKAEVFQKNDAR